MSKLAKALGALPYAHLLGISAAKADDGSDCGDAKQGADESDEDYAKRMEDEDKKEKEDDAKKAKAKAEDDEKKKDDEDKKAKRAEEDEGDKEKAARASERARCAAIFGCSAAGVRPDVAAHLAFTTSMSSADAIAMLGTVATGGAQPRNLASRMAALPATNVGADAAAAPAASSPQGVAARIIAAGKARRGEA